MQNQITYSFIKKLALWGATFKAIQGECKENMPPPSELASTCSGRPANLSACHRPLISHNSLWQVHVLPSTQEPLIKEKKQHKVLLSKKVVLLSGGRAHAEPPAAVQTHRRPAEQGWEHVLWSSRAWTAVPALTLVTWGLQVNYLAELAKSPSL